jgi:hypothetical protein
MPYSSDLNDEEWEIFEPLLLQILPPKKQTRPANWTKREIVNGILYQLKNGCNWCDLQARLATLLDCLLALQALASRRSIRATDECFTSTSP